VFPFFIAENTYCSFDVTKIDEDVLNPTPTYSIPKLAKTEGHFQQSKGSTSDSQIFSDLQDFVKATLEANDDKVESCFSNDALKDDDAKSANKPSVTTHCFTQLDNFNEELDVLDTRHKVTVNKLSTDVQIKQQSKIDDNVETCSAVTDLLLKKSRRKKRGSFKCEDCKRTFKLLGAFNNHKKNGKCLFVCQYCGKEFTSRYYCNYLTHLKYHSNERVHKCSVCDKTYIEAHTLKLHMRKHSGDRPFICDYCGKRFFLSSQLVSHKNSTHKESTKVHKCDICGQILSTVGNLCVHKRVVHSMERPFTCELCGKTFKTHKSLDVHSKVHQEVYPFKCDILGCEKTFKRSEGLVDHMRRHRNERTHFCDQCGKGFYCNKDLQLHVRVHTGDKPFSCDLCGYKCALAGNLNKHRKTHQS